MQALQPVRRRNSKGNRNHKVTNPKEQLADLEEEKERSGHQVEGGSEDEHLDQEMVSSDSGSVYEWEEMNGPTDGQVVLDQVMLLTKNEIQYADQTNKHDRETEWVKEVMTGGRVHSVFWKMPIDSLYALSVILRLRAIYNYII